MNAIDVVDEHIEKYRRLSELAYERGWFKEQEQYSAIAHALEELKFEL